MPETSMSISSITTGRATEWLIQRTGAEVWDFEIQEEKVYKSYNRRIIRPYQQEKPREASHKDWLVSLREHWETVSNAALQKAGVVKRYHLSSNASVGIELDPLKHIPSKTFNKERKGELTADGVTLAQRQWQVIQERLVRDHETGLNGGAAFLTKRQKRQSRLWAPKAHTRTLL